MKSIDQYININNVPEPIQEIMNVVGEKKGIDIWRRLAGQQVYFPSNIERYALKDFASHNPTMSVDEMAHACKVSRKTIYNNL